MKRRGFTLVELLIVVITLGIIAAILIPQFMKPSPLTPEEWDAEVEERIVEKLGEEWRGVEAGDLIRYENGNLVLVWGFDDPNGFELYILSGSPGSRVFLREDHEFSGSETLIRRNNPENPNLDFQEAWLEFLQQGLDRKLDQEKDRP